MEVSSSLCIASWTRWPLYTLHQAVAHFTAKLGEGGKCSLAAIGQRPNAVDSYPEVNLAKVFFSQDLFVDCRNDLNAAVPSP